MTNSLRPVETKIPQMTALDYRLYSAVSTFHDEFEQQFVKTELSSKSPSDAAMSCL